MRHLLRLAGLALTGASALALSACVTGEDAAGPNYPAGFADGCRTAEAQQASFRSETFRDKVLFDSDGSYRVGWRAGYLNCDRVTDLDNRPGDLGEVDPN